MFLILKLVSWHDLGLLDKLKKVEFPLTIDNVLEQLEVHLLLLVLMPMFVGPDWVGLRSLPSVAIGVPTQPAAGLGHTRRKAVHFAAGVPSLSSVIVDCYLLT